MSTTDDTPETVRAHPNRPRFDPTINLGHMLTFVGFIATGFAAYSTIERRLAVNEIKMEHMEKRVSDTDGRIKDSLVEIKNDLREVKRSVETISGRSK